MKKKKTKKDEEDNLVLIKLERKLKMLTFYLAKNTLKCRIQPDWNFSQHAISRDGVVNKRRNWKKNHLMVQEFRI